MRRRFPLQRQPAASDPYAEMNLFRRQKPATPVAAAHDSDAPSISAEANVRMAVHAGVDRRRPQESFSVLCVIPQAVGHEPDIPAEIEAVTRNIALELRSDDRFCRLEDGAYLVLLQNTSDELASVVAQRLAVNLTVRSGAVRHRKWLVGVAGYPRDAKTEAALIELARLNAVERDVA